MSDQQPPVTQHVAEQGASWTLPYLAMAAIGGLLFFNQLQAGQEQDAVNVSNLPALEARIEALENENTNLRTSLADAEADRIRDAEAFQAQLDRRIERELQGQIDRRFADTQNLFQVEVDALNARVDQKRDAIAQLELTIDQLQRLVFASEAHASTILQGE